MNTHRAELIAAIREAPDDDGLRLACADWFEEQGDPVSVARADFIRVQIRRAQLPDDAPEQCQLQSQELRLLKQYAAVWCGSHFVFKKVRFRRGFIEFVHLHLRHFLHHRRQMLDLEPVRDVRLTGWFRTSADLVRRVAGCAEWKFIETLRIHHQGPHSDPRGEVVLLLESPHFRRLRAFHCPGVTWSAEERRRFERLEVLRQIQELQLPELDYLGRAGEWFADGGWEFADRWAELRSLILSGFQLGWLRRLSEAPFWERLAHLTLGFSHEMAPAHSLLSERLPASLRSLRWRGGYRVAESTPTRPFFERLARTSLHVLWLAQAPTPTDLQCLLSDSCACRLRDLFIARIGEEHAQVISDSPGAVHLRRLSVGSHAGAAVVRRLFSSKQLTALTHLDLSGVLLDSESVRTIAAARGWDRLRFLQCIVSGGSPTDLRALLGAPVLHRLSCLWLSVHSTPSHPQAGVIESAAADLFRLPNLAAIRLDLGSCPPAFRQALTQSDAPLWASIACEDEVDVRLERESLAASQRPPVDDVPWLRSWQD